MHSHLPIIVCPPDPPTRGIEQGRGESLPLARPWNGGLGDGVGPTISVSEAEAGPSDRSALQDFGGE